MTDRTAAPNPSRGRSFAIVVVAYLLAVGVLWVTASFLVSSRSMAPVWALLAGDLLATLVIFGWSRAVDNSSMYDAYWSVIPPFLALFLVVHADPGVPVARQALVVALLLLWAIRLTANWARGWPGLHHEDWRYVDMRHNGRPYWLQSFFGLHLFPTLEVYLCCLALVPALAVGTRPLDALDLLAAVVTGGAVLIELVADEQLRAFNRTKQPGEICTKGLWSWSRHPNYFGELSFWWGLWLFGVAADPGWWWTVVGPLAMTAMFQFASIPMIDRRSQERRPGYAEHMARVPRLVPRPPRRVPATGDDADQSPSTQR